MSKRKEDEEEKEKKSFDWSNLALVPLLFVLVVPVMVAWEEWGNHIYGSRPQDLVDVPITEATPKKIEHALRSTTERHGRVVVTLLSSAHPYKSATFDWSTTEPTAPDEISLETVKHEGGDSGDDVVTALRHRFHGFDSNYTWGTFAIYADKRDGSARIHVSGTKRTNSLFSRQIEAGRQVLLNAAFGTAISVSDREIADVLGGGYPIIELAKIDPKTQIEQAKDVVMGAFPGALHPGSDIFDIALDDPLFASTRLSWHNEPGGTLSYVALNETAAFVAGRAMFVQCLTTKAGPGRDKVIDYAAGKKDTTFMFGSVGLTVRSKDVRVAGPFDAASLNQLYAALAACHETTEGGTTTRSEKR